MKRKLYALFILIGAIGALFLAYLYFFVYYTWNLTIESNVDSFSVDFFSPWTTQKWTHQCSENICFIPELPPFDYNISIIKTDYQTQVFSYKINPRKSETLIVELEKQVQLDPVISEEIVETAKQKIQRIRDENLYYAKFSLGNNTVIRFKEEWSELAMQYVENNILKEIQRFPTVAVQEINVTDIYSSPNIYVSIGESNYIFDTVFFRLYQLPIIKNIKYLKYDTLSQNYIIVTDVWSFTYDISTTKLEYQYLFKDYISTPEFIIWVIFADEEQKKENFNITKNANVIVKYSQTSKERKVVYSTGDSIDQIYQQWDQIFIVSGQNTFELKNFD